MPIAVPKSALGLVRIENDPDAPRAPRPPFSLPTIGVCGRREYFHDSLHCRLFLKSAYQPTRKFSAQVLIPNIHRPEEFWCPSSPFGAVRSQGLTTMVQNIAAGLVVVALIVIGSISYAQKHHHCEQGYVLKHWRAHALKKTQETCGSMSPSI